MRKIPNNSCVTDKKSRAPSEDLEVKVTPLTQYYPVFKEYHKKNNLSENAETSFRPGKITLNLLSNRKNASESMTKIENPKNVFDKNTSEMNLDLEFINKISQNKPTNHLNLDIVNDKTSSLSRSHITPRCTNPMI